MYLNETMAENRNDRSACVKERIHCEIFFSEYFMKY